MRILIAEDEAISLKVIESIIGPVADFESVQNGQAAFDTYCNAWDNGQPFDLILLDVMMPVFDGQEVLSAIREREQELGIGMDDGVKVIMTTALDDGQSLYQAHANGCVNYLVKPISKDKLLSAIRRLGFKAESRS